MASSLSISIVTFRPDIVLLKKMLDSLSSAIDHAREASVLGDTWVYIVDNGPVGAWLEPLRETTEPAIGAQASFEIISGHGNRGYGSGHNLAIQRSSADYHLVLNPDVILSREALSESLQFMDCHPDVIILGPRATDRNREPQWLTKRYPSVLDLFLRGFAPEFVARRFKARLDRYEMRELPSDSPTIGVPLLSGCFMFCRRKYLTKIGGFSPDYFMYFEDFDLCVRASRIGMLAHVPTVQVVHLGGHAAKKGFAHIHMFINSALRFFFKNGWRWS
jgi:GT2 family glycosyltransferase